MIELAIIATPFTLLALAGSIAFLGVTILIKNREDDFK